MPNKKTIHTNSHTRRNNSICFIGAPGTGKSTLCAALPGSSSYIGAHDAFIRAARPLLDSQIKSLPARWLTRLLTALLPAPKAFFLLKNMLRKDARFLTGHTEYHHLAQMHWDGVTAHITSAVGRAYAASFFLEQLMIDAVISHHDFGRTAVVHDDSLWQSMRIDTTRFSSPRDLPPLPADLPPRKLILCTLSSDEIFSRIKKRANSGKTNVLHTGLTDDELLKSILYEQENARLKSEWLSRNGSDVLTVDTASSAKEISRTIDRFLSSRREHNE